MKHLIILASLVFSMTVGAQVIPVANNSTRPAITEAGKPLGKLSEMNIGTEGGNLFSSDKKIELKVPPGALSKNTNISILPITNKAPNGNGTAYRMNPSGINFQKPVQLIFHYTKEESAEEMQMLMGIAMQDEKGQWFKLKKYTLDTVSKTISGFINHFSDWSRFDALQLLPPSGKVKVSKTMSLQLVLVEASGEIDNTGGDGDMLEPLVKSTDDGDLLTALPPKNRARPTFSYKVNGVPWGNQIVGQLRGNEGNSQSFIYHAPASVPEQNPVAVTVEVQGESFEFNGVVYRSLKVVSNILVYDNAYEVKMVSRMKGGSNASWAGEVTYHDEGSFIVLMSKGKPEVKDIVNNFERISTNCRMQIFNPETCTGQLHITGVRGIRLIPATPPQNPYATIEIIFIQNNAEHIKFKLTDCPPPPGARGQGKTDERLTAQQFLMDVRVPGMPVHMKFKAKPGEQIIWEEGKEGGELHVKYSVKQIIED